MSRRCGGPQDIVPLAEQFLSMFAVQATRAITGFTERAHPGHGTSQLAGNVRELPQYIGFAGNFL